MKLAEVPNGSLKQYYYDVIKELQGENNEILK